MKDVMLDMETAGMAPGSVILTIGAVAFDPHGDALHTAGDHTFYRRVDMGTCMAIGLTVDHETLSWWMGQSAEAREEAFTAMPRTSINEALLAFVKWFREGTPTKGDGRIWSHGAGFDVVLFEAALRAAHLGPPPWEFRNVRDTRTLFEVGGLQGNRTVPRVPHHALHDAIAQAEDVQRAYRRLGIQEAKGGVEG